MHKSLYHKILVFSSLLFVLSITLKAQESEINDSTDISEMLSGMMNRLDVYNTKWLTIGSHYDFFSSTTGLQISNGYDERPLIHFEDFSEDFVFKIQGNTDFNKDYSYGLNVGWKYPRYLSLIAMEFYNCNYSNRNFDLQYFNISAETYIKNTDIVANLKLAVQNLNNERNVGIELGISNVFIYQKLYAGLTAGYYFDYFTYGGFIRSFIYKNIIGIGLDYKRISNYDFLNLGLHYTFRR